MFGWEWTDVPMGDSGMSYTMFNLDGKTVAALGPQMPGMFPEGAPPCWNPYIATDDVDATVEQARALGANIIMGPAGVGNGRVALLQDPWGAMFFLWQALEFGGSEIIRTPGALAWTELYTRDLATTQSFYSDLFGWEWNRTPIPQGGIYHLANLGDFEVAGLLVMDEQWAEVPPHWMIYFQVENADAAAAKVMSLGGDVCVPGHQYRGRPVRSGQRRPKRHVHHFRAHVIHPSRLDARANLNCPDRLKNQRNWKKIMGLEVDSCHIPGPYSL